ncbi:hypothetical protein B0H12DRAFT_1237044 [Mycena haematopus]|nr:hypothetical protein B0H12DRAFT_1237044 [Mycena haematopus]
MEAYFRAFIAMGSAVRGDFLRRIRTETPNTGLRDVIEHFWLRGLLCGAISAPTSTSAKGITKPSHKKLVDALLAGQLNVKRLLKTKWDGGDYVDEAEFEARNKSLTDEERWIACNSAPALPTAPPALNSTPPTALMRQSYVWNANSCFIDAPMEAYFRAFIAMGSAVRGDFLRRIRTETPNTGLRDVIEHFWLRGLLCGAISAPTSTSAKGITKPSHKKLVDALLAGQLNVKRLLKTKWDGGDYVDGMPGCSRTWVNQMVNTDTTSGVQRYFGISHSVNYSCKLKHSTATKARIWTEIGMNFNDLLLAQQFITPSSPRPSLDDYLMHVIPRERVSTSRTASYQPLHLGPPKICPNSSCNGADTIITSVSTDWPLVLRIDPICHSYNPGVDPPMAYPACPLTMNLGPDVQYELISRVIYIPKTDPTTVGHFVTKTRLKGKTYLHDGLRRDGALAELGPLHLLEEFDARTVYVVYLRTSKTSTTNRTVAEILADFEKVPARPPVYISVPDDSGEENSVDDEVSQMLIDSIASPVKTSDKPSAFPPLPGSQDRFYTPDESPPASPGPGTPEMDHERSFAETDSQTACPVLCHGCGMQNPDGDGVFEEVQCERCRNWSHIACLPSGVDWDADDVHFVCKYCLNVDKNVDPLAEILWPGRTVMVPDPNAPDWKAPGVLWYPAKFIKRHKNASKHREYEFQWFECTDGTVYRSADSLLPPELLRKFSLGREFCEEIENIDLTAEQLGKIRLPFYLFPDHPEHKNPELTEVFNEAIPHVARILATFDTAHPVVAHFKQYFRGQKPTQWRRLLAHWMSAISLVPTPELEEVLIRPLTSLLSHESLVELPDEVRNDRVMGVGSALLQMLAVQKELGEPFNLNGDTLDDIFTGRVVRCSNDGPAALAAMFAALPLSNVNSGELVKQMLNFNNAHIFYDPEFRPPTFSREAKSSGSSTTPILVHLKRKPDIEIEGEKPQKRSRKATKPTKEHETPAPQSTGKVWSKRLRTRTK